MEREDYYKRLRLYRVECYEAPSEENKAKGAWASTITLASSAILRLMRGDTLRRCIRPIA